MSTSTMTDSPARFGFRGLGAVMAIAVFGALIVGWVSLRHRLPGTVEPASEAEPMSGRVEGEI
jgi:hypothetical protein